MVIQRHYKDNISKAAINSFKQRVIGAKLLSAPVVHMDKCSFLFIKEGELYICAVTRQNANPSLVFQFLYTLVSVLKAYFAGKFDVEIMKNNFVLIFELLDEMMDHGYPQVTAINMLSAIIKNGTVKENVGDVPTGNSASITSELTGAVDWRQPDKYKYRKNEVFIDALECVNLLMSANGSILRSDVSGKVMMKTYLTGMPECKFAMNDKISMEHEAKKKKRQVDSRPVGITLDDCTFHRCVNLSHFDHDRTISFIPPDGPFELMRYRITEQITLPFKITPIVTEHGRSRVEYEVLIKGSFLRSLHASGVIVKIPCPESTSKWNSELSYTGGKVSYKADEHCIVWKFKKFHGDQQYRMSTEVHLVPTHNEKAWSRPPITLDFQLPMFTASGLHVRSLKVFEKSNYDTIKWVRYMTKAGQYHIKF